MLCRNDGDLGNEAVALKLSADSYYELQMMNDAKAAAEESLEISQFIGDSRGEHEATDLLSKISPKPDEAAMLMAMQMMQQQQGQPQPGQPAAGAIPFQPKQMQG